MVNTFYQIKEILFCFFLCQGFWIFFEITNKGWILPNNFPGIQEWIYTGWQDRAFNSPDYQHQTSTLGKTLISHFMSLITHWRSSIGKTSITLSFSLISFSIKWVYRSKTMCVHIFRNIACSMNTRSGENPTHIQNRYRFQEKQFLLPVSFPNGRDPV